MPCVRGTRAGLLRTARTRGAGQLVRGGDYGTCAVRAPASGVPYAPCTVAVCTVQAPHLPKISDYLVARLRDKDSTRELREACAAALGALVAELGPDAPPVVLRYLLPVLGETLEPVRLQPYVPEAATP